MFQELSVEIIIELIKNLAVPGNTWMELGALALAISIIIWRRRKK